MFLNKDLEKGFTTKGFVKTSLLNDNEVDYLLELYQQTKKEARVDKRFFTSIWSDNKAYRHKVDTQLKSILEPALCRVFNDFDTLFANMMVKKSGENTSLQPHQDWTFVDETRYQSITAWIPLVNVDAENGALEVCPGSHNMKNLIRARFANSPFNKDINEISENLMESIPMKKGEALLINSRLIHASPNNKSSEDRIAVSIVIKPQEAKAVHYVQDNSNSDILYQLEIKPTFFTEYSCFDYPDVQQARKLTQRIEQIDYQSLKSLVV